MSKNRNKNSNYKDDAPQATITDGSEKQDSKNAAASAVSADGEDLISLHIRRTNDEPGFRALNPYVRKRLYELTVAYLDKLCERSNFKVDKPYWKKIGGEITAVGNGYTFKVPSHRTDISIVEDLSEEIARIYGTAGYRVFPLSAAGGEGVDALRRYIRERALDAPDGGHVSGAFAGASGAGKSTLMTALFPDLRLATGSISRKTERGRHTTRHVELWPMDMDGGTFWIADTPGFSMLDFTRFDFFPYDELASSFREFGDCLGKCRYTQCTHLREEGCAVLEKMRNGGISESAGSPQAAMRAMCGSMKNKGACRNGNDVRTRDRGDLHGRILPYRRGAGTAAREPGDRDRGGQRPQDRKSARDPARHPDGGL